jgi:hypothetical protein
MWPVHTWLPDAHVEAPTAGSVILAGILLKLGGYGFVRFSLPIFPLASAYFAPLIFTLSAIAVIYTSLVALAQTDMKKADRLFLDRDIGPDRRRSRRGRAARRVLRDVCHFICLPFPIIDELCEQSLVLPRTRRMSGARYPWR